jgi:hypothetical protein
MGRSSSGPFDEDGPNVTQPYPQSNPGADRYTQNQ